MKKSAKILVIWMAAFILLCVPVAANNEFLVELHNIYRKSHQVDDLTQDSKLSADAAAYAKEIAAQNKMPQSNPSAAYGENICEQKTSEDINNDKVLCVSKWYDERKDYSFEYPRITRKTKHFTQLVWKASTKIGIGSFVSANGILYVVARYVPPGNVGSEADLRKNVLKEKKVEWPSGFGNLAQSILKNDSHKTQISKHLIILMCIYSFVF